MCHIKSDVKTLNFESDVTYLPPRKSLNDIRQRSLSDAKMSNIKETTNENELFLMS